MSSPCPPFYHSPPPRVNKALAWRFPNAEGGTIAQYEERLVERQEQELSYFRRIKEEIEQTAKSGISEEALEARWKAGNADLKHAMTTGVQGRTKDGLLKKTVEHMDMVKSSPMGMRPKMRRIPVIFGLPGSAGGHGLARLFRT